MKVAVIVPFRDRGDADRKANLFHTLYHLDACGFIPWLSDDFRSGPFNRSAAYNNGRALHPADVYVWHEADILVPHQQLRDAIEMAAAEPGLVVPFTEYRALSPEDTVKVRGGADPAGFTPEHVVKNGASIGAVGVCSEASMAAVGRWDEKFAGWGFDDNAMFQAFRVAAGPPRWVDGTAYHLWHKPGNEASGADAVATSLNHDRWCLYRDASTADEIRALTA